MSSATVAVAADADSTTNSVANNSVSAPAAVEVAAPQSQAAPPQSLPQSPTALDAQQPSPENTVAPTGAIPPTAADAPAHLAIPATPEFAASQTEKAAAPPAAPVTPTEAPKAVVEAPPPPPPPPTPAEILGLAGKDRIKAEKCLANAIYFEARGEPLRGQIAVAQVVMNRVFSPYYPKDVCSVVYQNAERHLSCQFTFACDGKSKATNERGAWWRAQRVAKQTLDGKVWIAAVAKSTHYHAYWVNPSWVAEMKKMFRYGVHTFYRPHRWGDGAQESGWVQAPLPILSPKVQAGPKPQAANEQKTPALVTTLPAVATAAAQPAKTDTKASDVKAAAAKTDTKATPAKADAKKSDAKVSPIYTEGKRSDAKTSPSNAQAKASTKIDPKAQSKSAQLKPAATSQPKPNDRQAKTLPANVQAKALPASAPAKPSATRSQTKPKTANGQAKSTEKL